MKFLALGHQNAGPSGARGVLRTSEQRLSSSGDGCLARSAEVEMRTVVAALVLARREALCQRVGQGSGDDLLGAAGGQLLQLQR